jgi:hypothetical protein
MREALSMSSLATCEVSSSVTSSLELASGPTPSASPGGPTTDPSGQVVAPASRSAKRDRRKDSPTPATCGLSGSGSSASRNLSASLASKLAERLIGSTLFVETWKVKVTPSGRQFWAHIASVRRILGSESTGWPTPQSHDERKRGNTEADHHYQPHDLSNMATWVSPQKGDADRGGQAKRYMEPTHAVRLNDQVMMSAWATPTNRDHKDGACQDQLENGTVPVNSLLGRQVLTASSWPTPMGGSPATDSYNEAGNTDSGRRTQELAGWVSPKASAEKMGRPRENDRGDLQAQATGAIATGSPASTAKPGQLNPAHSRWLMGLPCVWDDCGVTVTRSALRKPKPLSKPILTFDQRMMQRARKLISKFGKRKPS